jgi:hypothetical protein
MQILSRNGYMDENVLHTLDPGTRARLIAITHSTCCTQQVHI